MRWWTLLLLACTGATPDPVELELGRRGAALEAYRRGVAELEAGNGGAAREALGQALDHRVGDPLLLAWRARAEASDGDLDAAIGTLQTVLQRKPEFVEARYNLASYLARKGELEASGQHLRRALEEGAGDPRDVLDDPDFQPHLAHTAFGFLPRASVSVALKGPDGSVFLGSEVRLALDVSGRSLGPLRVEGPGVGGPLRLVRVDEVRTADDDRARITWVFAVDGPGQVPVGPLTVHSGDRVAKSEELAVLALAPPDREPVQHAAKPWRLPSSLGTPEATADAWVAGGELLVRSLPGDRVTVSGTRGAGLPWTWSEGNELRWTIQTWPDPGAQVKVMISRRGNKVFDASPRR